jgi:branched-chain amino acid transport system ATP-binding protein
MAVLEQVGLAGPRRAGEAALPTASGARWRSAWRSRPAALLFLDEPTSGLGADGTARLAALIRSAQARVTIVIIEHDMRFLFELADRISVIHWGQVIAEGTPGAAANKWVSARSALGSWRMMLEVRGASRPSTARRRRCSASR